MSKEKMFLNALSEIAKERGETTLKLHNEIYSDCISLFQFQRDYITLNDNDKKIEMRIERNVRIETLYKQLATINNHANNKLFEFEMVLKFRPLERGLRINNAFNNIIEVFKFIRSDEVMILLRKCN